MRFDPHVLKKLRIRAGLSVYALHNRMVRNGWSGTDKTIRNIEAGNVSFPHRTTLQALAEALKVPERVFFASESSTSLESTPGTQEKPAKRRSPARATHRAGKP